jgi:hypothetical protein
MLGYFVRGLLGVSSADSAHLFAMLRDHVTRLENTVRWRWSAGDVVIWDNCATQHKAIDDYGDQPRIVRRVTIDGPVSVGIDGRHGQKTQQRRSGRRGGLKEIPVAPESPRCTSVAARPLRQSRFGAPWKLFASGGMIDVPPASRPAAINGPPPRRRACWRDRRTPEAIGVRWKPAAGACLPSATCAPARSSGSRRRSARARRWCPPCTAPSPTPQRQTCN